MKTKLLGLIFRIAKSKLLRPIIGWCFINTIDLLPLNRITETPRVIAFYHPRPSYKIHVLIVPRKVIGEFTEIDLIDADLIKEMFTVANMVINKLDLSKKGYSLILNGGTKQEIKQVHFHLVSED
ncbi:MAG: hypothetical protein C0391_04985 [Anaerolinea sp.]|nr:hypothetical protein [Anaerolinea sp.]